MGQILEKTIYVPSENNLNAEKNLNELIADRLLKLTELELLYNTAPVGLCLIDKDLCFIRINEMLASINERFIEEHIGRSIYEIIPDIAPKIEPIYRKVIETGEPILNFEVQGTTSAEPSKEKHFLASYYPLKNGDGSVWGVSTVVQDITERKQAEEWLRNSEERYRALYENSPLMCFTIDTEGKILYVNRFGAEQLGYTAEELIGQSVLDVFYEEDKKAVLEQLTMCLQNPTQIAHWELRKVRKDRKMLWVREFARTMRDINGNTVVLIACEDISESKSIEEKLRESEERFRIVADNAPVMLWMAGPDKLCNYVNKGWLEFKGESIEKELGNGWSEGIHPDDLEHCLNTYLTAFDARQEFKVEYRLKGHDGEYRWILAHGVPRFSRDNSFIGYIGCCEDITDRKLVMDLQQERLRFETLLSGISSRFINLAPNEIDREFNQCLKDLVEFLGFDRCSIALFSEDMKKICFTHSYALPGIPPVPKEDLANHFLWYTDRLRKGEIIEYSNLPYGLPDEAVAEKDYCIKEGFTSHLAIPLQMNREILGMIGFGSFGSEIKWPDEIIQRLKIVGGIFANALARKRADLELKKAFSEINSLKNQLQKENSYLQQEIRVEHHYDEIIGQSDAVKAFLSQADQVAKTDSTVLIIGETGTGKELLAHSIHNQSSRKGRAMVKVNCAALPSTLIESEIFGREKGAYTGALTKQIGRFEVADGSTIFLDEISELSFELQAKLLRVLQEGQFERLGSPETHKVDVRIIAATNMDLEKAVSEGKFREDLYYRLNVFPINIPPLRERREDIPTLVWTFVKEFEAKMGKKIESIPRAYMENLQSYSWPGNIRELRNVVERAMILNSTSSLQIVIPQFKPRRTPERITLEDLERRHIVEVLDIAKWRVRGTNGAAEILGLKATTLESKMMKLGIKKKN